jgi:hypothetical protein
VSYISVCADKRAVRYSIHIHQQYLHDAHALIASHRWTGIGVGNYLAGDPYLGTQTSDPHEVVLLQAAEGGYGFAASFVFLIAATSFILFRMRSVAVAPAAAAVLIATVAHGLVAVCWVRDAGLGWLLVGGVRPRLERSPRRQALSKRTFMQWLSPTGEPISFGVVSTHSSRRLPSRS